MNNIHDLLELALEARASDLIVKAGSPPVFRVDGEIVVADTPALDRSQSGKIVQSIELAAQRDLLLGSDSSLQPDGIPVSPSPTAASLEQDRSLDERDYIFTIEDLARIRANVYLQSGAPAAAIRIIPLHPLTFDELELPEILKNLTLNSRGLILVTGPTGSGKSTTLAAMIDHINRNTRRNIITIEDPVEFVFRDDQSVIQQREVGRDTSSFTSALNAALRQSPDVLMVGEMRSLEAMEAVLTAAEVGNLVLSTLHTTSAPAAVDRLLNSFPPDQRPQITNQIMGTLVGIVSQRLIRRSDRPGRIAAVELMTSSPTVLKMIEEGNTSDLSSALREGSHYGMSSLNQSLQRLVRSDTVSLDVAFDNSPNPQELRQFLRHV